MNYPVLTAFAVLVACPPVVARADAPAHDIIVTAEMESRRLSYLQSPSFGLGIAPEQLAAINALNVEDLLRYAPATLVRKRYAGDPNATLSFRNMHTQQTPRALVLVDGFPIANFLGADFDTAPKWGVLAPDDVARIELLYGPTSARYSGNSMGGAMLLQTRDITPGAVRLDAQLFGQNYRYYATDEALYGWSVDTGLDLALGSRGGLALSYRHFRNQGQPQEWRTVQAGTLYAAQAIVDQQLPFLHIAAADSVVDTTQDQLRARMQYALTDDWRLHGLAVLLLARAETLNPKSFLYDANQQPSFVGIAGVSAGIAQSSELLSGLGLLGEAAGWDVALRFSRFDTLRNHTRRSDTYDLGTGLPPATGRLAVADAGWQNLEAGAERRLGAHALALGGSYARYQVETVTQAAADWLSGPGTSVRDAYGGKTQLLGGFAEDAILLTPGLTATLGLRFEHWRASAGYLLQAGQSVVRYAGRNASAWSPKAALTLVPDVHSEISLSIAQATRFPTVRELYQPGLIQYGAGLGNLDLNGFDPNLKPERATDLQLMASRRIGHVQITIDGYRQAVRETIFAQSIAIPDAATGHLKQNSLITNLGSVRTWGADLLLSAEEVLIPGLALDANLSWIDAKITENPLNPALVGNQFPRIPKWRVNASLRYSLNRHWEFAANLRNQSTPDRNLENNSTSKCGTFYCVTSFSFVDLRASYRAGAFQLSAGIDNLFDQKAFVYHPYPARSFSLSVKWNGGL